MSIASRIGQLEKELGSGGSCGCTPPFEIRVWSREPDPLGSDWPTEPDTTPAICEHCGRERRLALLEVTYEEHSPEVLERMAQMEREKAAGTWGDR